MKQTAEEQVVAWCRAKGPGYVARNLPNEGRHPGGPDVVRGVLNLNRSVPVPGGYSWETRPLTVVSGRTWEEVAEALRNLGK